MWRFPGLEQMRLRTFVNGRDAFDLILIALILSFLVTLSACSTMPSASPTIPPLPPEIAAPAKPFPTPPGLPKRP